MSVPALSARRASPWIPASAIAIVSAVFVAAFGATEPGDERTLPLAAAIALISLGALLRPFEPAPGEKFSLAGAVAFFAALVLPTSQAVFASLFAEAIARAIRRTSVVSALVNASKTAAAVAVSGMLARASGASELDPVATVWSGSAFLLMTLVPIAVMIEWTRGPAAVWPFLRRETLPTAALVAIGALAAAVWAVHTWLLVLLVLPLAMVEAAGRASARARLAHASLSRMLDAQRAFVADAAHELRTPLTAILGNVAYLENATLAPDDRAALSDAKRELAGLSSLVERLLLLSRADAAVPSGESCDLTRIARAVASSAVRRAGVRLELELSDEIRVNAARELVEALVRDLVTNAASYTERGYVRVSAHRRGASAVLEVRDSGIGIPSTDVPRVFERFFRGSLARRMAAGSGLGLAIARRIAEAHGGSVELESSRDGTVVRVLLPLAGRTS